jgi:hypothetical protein
MAHADAVAVKISGLTVDVVHQEIQNSVDLILRAVPVFGRDAVNS